MTDRIKNIKTTIMGLIVVVIAILGIIQNWFDWYAFATLMLLGYTFIMAKDSLIEGITLGFFKKDSVK